MPDAVTNELVKITKYVFDTITDPNRGTINVTQWCKRDACWESVKRCNIKLADELRLVLLSKDETKAADRDAKKDQKLISDVEAQKTVLELGADYWKAVSEFVTAKRIKTTADQLKELIEKYHVPVKTVDLVLLEEKYIFDGVLEIIQNLDQVTASLWPEEHYAALNVIYKASRTQNTIYLRLNYDEPSGTVVNVRKSMWIHPEKDRAISIREAARLQTFPDSFVFCGSKDQQYQQVGNAVPPIMAKSIAKKLAKLLNQGLETQVENGGR